MGSPTNERHPPPHATAAQQDSPTNQDTREREKAPSRRPRSPPDATGHDHERDSRNTKTTPPTAPTPPSTNGSRRVPQATKSKNDGETHRPQSQRHAPQAPRQPTRPPCQRPSTRPHPPHVSKHRRHPESTPSDQTTQDGQTT